MKNDQKIIDILSERDGILSVVNLTDGKRIDIFNIAWGKDFGEVGFHVTTNISPPVDGLPVDIFSTEDVFRIFDPHTGEELFRLY
jgi:hypothetical protein